MRRRRNQSAVEFDYEYGEWIPTEAVMFNEDGSVSLLNSEGAAMANPRRRNILDTPEDYGADIEELLNSAEERLSARQYHDLCELVEAMAKMRLG